MKRWRRLAPPHTDPWRPWLAWRGSLTWRITARSRGFRVQVIRQGLHIPNEDEYRQLGQPTHRVRPSAPFVPGRAEAAFSGHSRNYRMRRDPLANLK